MRTRTGIWYDIHGETGDPVLMLMGFGMRGLVWRPQIEDLKHHHTLATYDNRGLGKSPPPADDFSLVDMAEDAMSVVDDLGWDRFHVIAVSMGGMVAQELAIRYADRVKSLALIATQPGGPGAYIPPVRSFARLAVIALAGEKRRGITTRRLIHPEPMLRRLTPEQIEQRRQDAHGILGLSALRRRQLRAIRRHDTRDRLHLITAPTLVVQPALDRLCRPEHSYTLVEGIPKARLLRLPDAGHGAVFHAASELNPALLDHIGRNLDS